MEIKHCTLPKIKGKTWAIGDIHGFTDSFKSLLKKINPAPGDRLILLGDLIDRGPQSKELIDHIILLREEGIEIICIRGNHDDLMLKSYHEETNSSGFMRFIKRDIVKKSWLNMGGSATMNSFSARKMVDIDPKYFDFIEDMYHYIEDENHLYVHAGFDFSEGKPFENVEAMLWIREFRIDLKLTNNRKVVHGHTPLDFAFIQSVLDNPGRDKFIALDNGISMDFAHGKGSLLAFETTTKELVKQRRQEVWP